MDLMEPDSFLNPSLNVSFLLFVRWLSIFVKVTAAQVSVPHIFQKHHYPFRPAELRTSLRLDMSARPAFALAVAQAPLVGGTRGW